MAYTEIKLSASIAPETLIEKGREAGMSEDAVEYFRHAEEVPLIYTVDTDSGEVVGMRIAAPLRWEKGKTLEDV